MGKGDALHIWVSQVALTVKILPVSAGDARDVGLIPELGRSPGGGNGNPLQWLEIEDPGGLQSMGLQRVRQD